MRRLLLPIFLCAAFTYGIMSAWEIPRGDIIFNHKSHVGERSIGCTFCHESVEKSVESSDKNLPVMDRCFVCHNGQTAPVECDLCHRSIDEPKALENPAREVIFSHKAHLGRGLACEKCHRKVARAEEMAQDQFPHMGVCMNCHFASKKMRECTLCHTDTEMVRKNIHTEGWTHRHKLEGTQEPEKCRLCHLSDETCEECHLGDNLQQRTHKLNYEYEHSLDSRGKERDCLGCHDEAAFCSPCHIDREVMPEDHSGSFWISSGHADAAIKDIEACVACHESGELTCLECHEDRDGELGTVDPAPGGVETRFRR
jgi:hypothetical protein